MTASRRNPTSPTLSSALASRDWVHKAVRLTHVYPISAALLHKAPVPFRVPGGSHTYRLSSLDQLGTRSEIFKNEVYEAALEGSSTPASVIDLGCNAGWFMVWLSWRSGKRAFDGLLVDANPRLAREAAWHLRKNAIAGCHVVCGAAGAEPNGSTTFYVSVSATQSSTQPLVFGLPQKGRVREITVPTVSVGAEWQRRYGRAPVDLLKIDIEGAERGFLEHERTFVAEHVRRIVIEWHKWSIGRAELDQLMADISFVPGRVILEDHGTGLMVYERAGSMAVSP